MNPIAILSLMGEMGARYRESKIHLILDYTMRMCDNGRVLVISDSQSPVCVVFYSMTNEPDTFLKKGDYEYKSHDPEGRVAVLEKLVSRKWNKEIRQALESELIRKFPNMAYGTWYRYGKVGDRQVTAKVRRLQNV